MRLSPVVTALLLSGAIVAAIAPAGGGAAGEKQLRRIRGTIGYQQNANAPFAQVFGRLDLPDDAIAVTQAQSTAELVMPDSSIIALGENTHVQVGAFENAAEGPGSTLIVSGGALRFDVRRPAGGRANYKFITATSQIAVRGTIGLLSFVGGNTTVACVACAADSVQVTVGAQTFGLATGQVLTVGITGAVTTAAATSATLSTFSGAGLNPGASGPGAAGGGGAAGASTTGIAVGAAAAAVAAGVAISHNNNASPTPQPVTPTAAPSPSPTATASPRPTAPPTLTPTPTPVPTATPSIPGTVTVTGGRRAPAAGTAPPPPPALPAGNPRIGR
jgi:hypothetical protein